MSDVAKKDKLYIQMTFILIMHYGKIKSNCTILRTLMIKKIWKVELEDSPGHRFFTVKNTKSIQNGGTINFFSIRENPFEISIPVSGFHIF